MNLLEEVTKKQLKKKLPEFGIGDTVDVYCEVKEGAKRRIQVFNGTVIARKHGGIQETFTVRRIVMDEGVERTFPLHGPLVRDVRIRRYGKVRRAKLYYLRDRVGKETKTKEFKGRFAPIYKDPPPTIESENKKKRVKKKKKKGKGKKKKA